MASVERPYVQGRTSQVSDPISRGIYRTHLINTYRPHRAKSAITLMPTGSGNGSVKIMNLNTGKVCTRTRSQPTPLSMPQEWIEILVLWANVSGKLRSTETHWEYRGHELSAEDPTNLDAGLTKIVNLYNKGVRMLAPTEPVVPEPTPIEDNVTIA